MPSFVDPTEVLNQLGLKSDVVAADFGCGSGGWVLPLAALLEKGRVFAVDIQTEPLSALAGKAKAKKLKNIQTVLGDVEKGGLKIPDNFCDWVLATNLLFQAQDKLAVFREAKRVLKPWGKVLVVDWQANAALGPKMPVPTREAIRELGKSAGFAVEKDFLAGDYHYVLVFTKA